MLKIINGFPYKPRLDDFVKRNCIRTKDLEAFKLLLNQAVAIAQPKAAYLLGSIQRRSDEKVQINGIWFSSRILRVNLKPVNRIFAYVCTAGQEIAAWAGELQDMLEKFWADEIQRDLLQFAERALLEDIQMQYDPGPLSSMSPGSLDDFPLDQQAPLFELLGDTQASVGVEFPQKQSQASCLPRRNDSKAASFAQGKIARTGWRLMSPIYMNAGMQGLDRNFPTIVATDDFQCAKGWGNIEMSKDR